MHWMHGLEANVTEPTEPCGNEDCDKCYPIPRFVVSTERVARLRHERTIKATSVEEALRIYREGTAWPSSYDDRELAVLEESATVVAIAEPRRYDADEFCYHKQQMQTSSPDQEDA